MLKYPERIIPGQILIYKLKYDIVVALFNKLDSKACTNVQSATDPCTNFAQETLTHAQTRKRQPTHAQMLALADAGGCGAN